MSQKTKIEWTGTTWNPIRARVRENAVDIAESKGYKSLVQILTSNKSDGMTPRVIPGKTWGYHCVSHSPGCTNCYACTMNGRTLRAWGTGLPYDRRAQDLVEFYLDETELLKPLKWKPGKVFPCSMTDLFADFVPDEFIDKMFAVMASCQQLTFQVLTKRADRMSKHILSTNGWLLPNVQLGFSAEDQPRFDERWAHVKPLAEAGWFTWASLEPLLGAVNVVPALETKHHLSWAVLGGESGPGARPFDIAWARYLIDQFLGWRTPLFVKQLGAKPFDNDQAWARCGSCGWVGRNSELPRDPEHLCGADECPECKVGGCICCCYATEEEAEANGEPGNGSTALKLKDRKGGDMSEWPEDIRVRQFPESR